MLLVHTYSKTKSKIVMNQSNTCINPLKNQTEGLLNRRNVPNSHCPAMFVFCVSFTYDRIYLYEKLKQSHYVCKVQKWRQFYLIPDAHTAFTVVLYFTIPWASPELLLFSSTFSLSSNEKSIYFSLVIRDFREKKNVISWTFMNQNF